MFKLICKIPKILKAYARKWGWIKIPVDLQKLSKKRTDICVMCFSSKVSRIVQVVNGTAQFEDSLICTECSCPCVEKSLVISETCPLDKWPE